jgi:hypothetical protein
MRKLSKVTRPAFQLGDGSRTDLCALLFIAES